MPGFTPLPLSVVLHVALLSSLPVCLWSALSVTPTCSNLQACAGHKALYTCSLHECHSLTSLLLSGLADPNVALLYGTIPASIASLSNVCLRSAGAGAARGARPVVLPTGRGITLNAERVHSVGPGEGRVGEADSSYHWYMHRRVPLSTACSDEAFTASCVAVTVSCVGRVPAVQLTKIFMGGLDLSGTLPSSFSMMSKLETL